MIRNSQGMAARRQRPQRQGAGATAHGPCTSDDMFLREENS